MGQSESRVEPEGQTVNVAPRKGGSTQSGGFTTQETKDYCKKIQDEVNKDMPYI